MTEPDAWVRSIIRTAGESPIRAMMGLAGEPGMISLAGGHPDAQSLPRDWLVEAASAVLRQLRHADLQYGATEGLAALRDSVCELLLQRRIKAQPADLIITTGSQQGMSLLANAVLDSGDAIAMAPLNYPAAMQCVRYAGARIVTLDAGGEGLGKAVRASTPGRVKAAYVVPNFANPTGHVMPAEARLRLLQEAQQLGVLIVEDDPYGDLWFDRAPPDSLYAMNQMGRIGATVVYLSSFSKTVMPALRLGVLCAPPAIRHAVKLVKQAADVHSGLLEQRILDAMLRSGRLAGHLDDVRATYRLKARTMVEALRTMAGNHLSFQEPAGGMFVWAQLEGAARQVAGADWFDFGRTHRVLVVPGQAFSADGRPNGYIRLTFANPGVEEIRVGVKRLVTGLNAESTRMAAHGAN